MLQKNIGLIGAMPEEIHCLLQGLDDYTEIQKAGKTFYKGQYQDQMVIICQSGIGKVNAALTATILIIDFNVSAIGFTGVAGGIAPDIQVGDLVLATTTAQHDVDVTAFGYEVGQIPQQPVFLATSDFHNQQILSLAQDYNIPLKKGCIVTGDQFVQTAADKQQLHQTFFALAVEMEGASVHAVCHAFNIPCVLLRGISDTANGQATDDFEKFVKASADRSAQLLLAWLIS